MPLKSSETIQERQAQNVSSSILLNFSCWVPLVKVAPILSDLAMNDVAPHP